MAFAYPSASGPALAAPTVHGYGLSTTPAVLPGVSTPFGQTFSPYSAGVGSALPFGQDFSSAFAGAAPFGGVSSFGAAPFGGASAFGAAPFAGSSFAGASPFIGSAAPIVADSGFTSGAPIVSDFNGLYSGYQGQGLDAGFGGAPFIAPSVYGGQFGGDFGGNYGGYNTVSGAVAAPVAPARKVWQNGLRRSLVTGHPTRF